MIIDLDSAEDDDLSTEQPLSSQKLPVLPSKSLRSRKIVFDIEVSVGEP